MTYRRTIATFAAAALALSAPAGVSLAHHGWEDTIPTPFVLTGTIVEIYLGNPHVHLIVQNAEGMWDVDLAPLIRTVNAGFDERAASVGNEVTLYGYRYTPAWDDLGMKAVRVVVNGTTYDVYPDRVAPFN